MAFGLDNNAQVARARARAAASHPTGITEGSNAGQYAGVESVASHGTPVAASGSASAAPPPAATTPSVTATPAPPTAYNPYLTPGQIAAYTNAVNRDQGTINGAAATQGNLQNRFLQSSAANGARAATSFNNSNQGDAARGFGFSGIHDTAMADIQANALINQNNYNTAYKTGLGTLANSVTAAQNDLGNLGLEYAGIATQNAQTLADANGGVVGPNTYQLPTVAPTPVTPTPTPVSPVTYFQNPNMGAINSAIASGAAAGTAAGV
jgi:hypothetical protein